MPAKKKVAKKKVARKPVRKVAKKKVTRKKYEDGGRVRKDKVAKGKDVKGKAKVTLSAQDQKLASDLKKHQKTEAKRTHRTISKDKTLTRKSTDPKVRARTAQNQARFQQKSKAATKSFQKARNTALAKKAKNKVAQKVVGTVAGRVVAPVGVAYEAYNVGKGLRGAKAGTSGKTIGQRLDAKGQRIASTPTGKKIVGKVLDAKESVRSFFLPKGKSLGGSGARPTGRGTSGRAKRATQLRKTNTKSIKGKTRG
jgi:hypothetical protein